MHAMLYSLPQLYPLPSQFSALIVWSVLKSCMSGSSTICTDHTPCPALQRFVQTTLHALLFKYLYRTHSMPCSSTICTDHTPCPALQQFNCTDHTPCPTLQRFVQNALHALLFNDLYRMHSMPCSSTICTDHTPCPALQRFV